MTLDVNDEDLFSEWSRTQAWHDDDSWVAPSLAPYDIALDEPARYAPVSPERRRKLTRYVSVTVGVCMAVCLVAAVRVGVSRAMASSETEESSGLSLAATSDRGAGYLDQAPVAAPRAVEVASPPAATTGAAEESGAKATARQATPPSRLELGTASPTVKALAASASGDRTASEERELARRALERGKMREAIGAAERSTALDPSDAEAWLILGAAKQEIGHGSEALAAFRSCTKVAKKGPVSECRSMLR
jgi:cytochrome c-type biogenesis protein CcmH/NrfG